MTHPFVEKINEKNLCSWYILPWLGLSIADFGTANFINSFLVKDRMIIAVEIIDFHLCVSTTMNEYYWKAWEKEGKSFLLYDVPRCWEEDLQLFLEGKYSDLSAEAKDVIKQSSGLKYDVADKFGNLISDALILALDNHEVLKETWKEVLNVPGWALPEHLLSAPAESSFITLKT